MIQQITQERGSQAELRDAVKDALKERFLPEFLNRIDETIVFHPLQREQISKIVTIQINHLRKQLEAKHIALEVTDRALKALATEGYDPNFGARPLKRVVQQRLQNPLATELLKGAIQENQTVRIDYDNEEFSFKVANLAAV
jgi:ATP-dependent Clp protease ATP-binding subunit ClpB